MSSPTTALPKLRAKAEPEGRPRPADGTLRHLKRALALLRVDAPSQYAAIAAHLRRAPGKYLVGAERFTVVAADRSITATAGWRLLGAELEAEMPAQAILDLFDGTTTVERLVAMDVLRIKAGPSALLAIDDATRVLAAAAIDSRPLQNEFDRYRTWVLSLTPEDRHAERIR